MSSTRRAFLQQSLIAPVATGGLALQPSPQGQSRGAGAPRKPRRLRPGDVVGIVDPASATWDPVDVDIVVESLAALGLKARLGAHLMDRHGYLAGRDEDRAADVMAMFTDPGVAAVHALRGGWGCARLLPHLDFEAIAKNPKILLGYSDITALLLPVYAKGRFVTFHGMNGDSEWNRFNVDWFRRVLMQGEAVTMTNPLSAGDQLVPVENRIRTITPGQARGHLVGGNLTVLTTIVGSGLLPDFTDAILFVEDVQEAPYRIDRMFMQLSLSGVLGKLKGVIFGRCTKCEPGDGGYGSLTISDILDDYLKPLKVPAWEGAQIGHIDRQFIMPLGVQAEIDADRGSIRLLEPAVT
ncbi:putative murein peptide carboxypeptidase [Luteitalea pratensis]|uniref:Putative murein peptide carboxypeptidase n=1 Tax=Luteitalea pratensis TaxID=1855912 RepID=A0A143PXX5_LUTPR|nr:LD-carboxypeptidase [Luteitalea pratensis]AMY12900.1 putative murein peptide carboxypeptidase [Luteitalea pratensis]